MPPSARLESPPPPSGTGATWPAGPHAALTCALYVVKLVLHVLSCLCVLVRLLEQAARRVVQGAAAAAAAPAAAVASRRRPSLGPSLPPCWAADTVAAIKWCKESEVRSEAGTGPSQCQAVGSRLWQSVVGQY